MTQEQNPASQPDTDTGEAGSLDAAELAFAQRDTPAQPEQQPEADEAQATDDDPNAEGEQAESDEDTAAELETVEVEGITLALTKEQAETLQKATLRQADYSRKMNEVSAKEKAAVQRLEQAERLAGGVEKYAEAMANIRVIDQQIKQFEAVNWQQLRQDDPAQYAALATDMQTLRLTKQQAEQAAQGIGSIIEQERQAGFAQERQAMTQALQKEFKDWAAQSQVLVEYAAKAGVQEKTLATLTDPAMVLALEKARKYDALQASKATLKATVKAAPPVVKPGAPRKAPDAQTDAMSQLRKFKTRDAAEVAFLARMK